MKNIIKYKSLLILSLVLFSCKLDLPNPNNPNDGQILTSREGMISLSIGMKQVYSTLALEALTVTPGTTSREVKGITTFTNIIEKTICSYQYLIIY